MSYTIGEISKITNIQISALRYYDKEGLLPLVERTANGIRKFNDNDIEWLNFIKRLKNTGMQLKEIKSFFQLCEEGDSTIECRYKIFLKRKADTEKQIELLQKSLDLINHKCNYYKIALEAGTTNIPELQKQHTLYNCNLNNQLFRDVVGKK